MTKKIPPKSYFTWCGLNNLVLISFNLWHILFTLFCSMGMPFHPLMMGISWITYKMFFHCCMGHLIISQASKKQQNHVIWLLARGKVNLKIPKVFIWSLTTVGGRCQQYCISESFSQTKKIIMDR